MVSLRGNQDNTKKLENIVNDYKRFSFVLLSLTVFLFLGLIIPTQELSQTHHILLIGLIVVSISLSFVFHRKAMKYREKLFEEQI